ncbi:insulinase family protein [Bdellovibrio sp. qaytius]|nr:insulinase family protein [Bdellovibrio sp. qaytius]
MKQVKFQLKNKLQVILIPSHKSPVVSVQMWVKTGSADEKKGEEGISHFIEHLVFKGTHKYKVGEIASVVEASGGELNAYTSFDQTVFYVTISKSFQDVALDVISQMMGHPTFDKDETHSEREVVCEEIKMGQDSPGRQSSQLLFSSVFKKHAYGIPVIGYEKNVRSWPVKKLKSFYQSRYVPSNMCLIISGDFEEKEMRGNVEKYFSSFKPYKLKKIKRTKEPKATKVGYKAKTKDLKDSSYNLAFPAPAIKHKDVPALDVMAMVLGQGETSRLFSKLRLESSLVSSVSSYSYTPQDPGLLALSFKVLEQDPKLAFEGIYQEVEKIKSQEVGWEEIRKAIINISSEQFYSIETVDGIASKIGSSQFYMGDSLAHEKYLKVIQKITPKDVMRVAKKYFDPKVASYTVLGPKKETEYVEILKDAHKIWLQTIAAYKKAKPIKAKNKKVAIPKIVFKDIKKTDKSDIEVVTTSNGTRVIFEKSLEIPTVSARILLGGGARIEDADKMGTSELLGRTWLGGTKNRSEAQILQMVEESAAGLSPFSGKNTVGFSLDYMKPFESKIVGLTEELFLEPEFVPAIVDRERQAMQRQIHSKEDQPSYLCGKQFVKNMFPNHPVSFDQLGTIESTNNIHAVDLNNYLNKVKSSKNMLAVVVGDFDKKTWMDSIERLEKEFKRTPKLLPTTDYKKLTKNESYFTEKDKEQSHVIVGWQGINITDPDRYVLHVIQAIMAGQGGRLFIELRDKNSLAYSVSPIRMESLECGYFGGYIACSPDKVEKAIKMFHVEFEKIRTQSVPHAELERAQRYLIGQNDIGLQRKSSLCNTIAFDDFYGNDFNESLHIDKVYNAITSADVKRVAERLFSQPHITSIVGKKV